jgi:predicted nucleotidyltransferase
MSKEKIFARLIQLLCERGAVKVAVFGSYIKGKNKPGSDIDVIVEFAERKSLLDLVGIEREVSKALGIKVDLLTEKSISPYMIDSIKREMKVIYY